MDYSLPVSSVHGIFLIRVLCFLLQGIFLTQGLNLSSMSGSPALAEDLGSIPELGGSSGEGNGYSLQYSGLENSVDRGAWWATAHRVTKSRPQLRTNPCSFPLPWELWIPNFPWPQWCGSFLLSFLYISSTLLVMLSISEYFLWAGQPDSYNLSWELQLQLKPSAE